MIEFFNAFNDVFFEVGDFIFLVMPFCCVVGFIVAFVAFIVDVFIN